MVEKGSFALIGLLAASLVVGLYFAYVYWGASVCVNLLEEIKVGVQAKNELLRAIAP